MKSTDPLHGLFNDRAPEVAARQLAVVVAWLTECQLASLESIASKRSTPKGELERHRRICDDAVKQCADLGLGPGIRGLRGFPCPRLDDALRALAPTGAHAVAAPNNCQSD